MDAGFSQIAFMAAGSMASTPVDVIAMGITSNENCKTTRFKGIKIDALDQELPNMENLLLAASTPQMSLYMFTKLLSYRKGNCDIQIITREGKVFKFPAATYPLGIKPKLEITDDSRLITVEIEGAFPTSIWTAIQTAALTAEAVDLSLTPLSGADYSKQKLVYPLATECPIGTELHSAYEKRSLKIEPKETARVNILQTYNIANFNSLTATIDIQLDDVSLAEEIALRAKGFSPSFLFKDGNGSTTYDAFSFAANVLGMKVETEDNGSKRTANIEYKRSFPIAKMTGTYGTGNGGSAADEGKTGGTLTIAA